VLMRIVQTRRVNPLSPIGGEGEGEGAACGVEERNSRSHALPPHPGLSPDGGEGGKLCTCSGGCARVARFTPGYSCLAPLGCSEQVEIQ